MSGFEGADKAHCTIRPTLPLSTEVHVSDFLIQIILAVGFLDAEDTFWIQIFVFLLLVVLWGLYYLVKSRPNEFKDQQYSFVGHTRTHRSRRRWQFQLSRKLIAQLKGITRKYATKAQRIKLHISKLPKEPMLNFGNLDVPTRPTPKDQLARKKTADLSSGMELLELDFLLSVVENTAGNDPNDVTMRKLNFNELLRREKQNQISSSVLKIYAINQGNLYGKRIQCEAVRELAVRTSRARVGPAVEGPARLVDRPDRTVPEKLFSR